MGLTNVQAAGGPSSRQSPASSSCSVSPSRKHNRPSSRSAGGYGGQFNSRAAYRWSCEVSVYLELGRRRTGAGRMLYEALFDRLVDRGLRMAVAGMTLPNDASVGLHRAMGFDPVGTYRHIGWKHDAWHDVAWAQRALATDDAPPDVP